MRAHTHTEDNLHAINTLYYYSPGPLQPFTAGWITCSHSESLIFSNVRLYLTFSFVPSFFPLSSFLLPTSFLSSCFEVYFLSNPSKPKTNKWTNKQKSSNEIRQSQFGFDRLHNNISYPSDKLIMSSEHIQSGDEAFLFLSLISIKLDSKKANWLSRVLCRLMV